MLICLFNLRKGIDVKLEHVVNSTECMCTGATVASDDSSDDSDDDDEAAVYNAEMQAGQPTPLMQSWGSKAFAKPLGKACNL